MKEYEEALKINPNDVGALFELGFIFEDQGFMMRR
ncbi:MAG: hypothetical protein B5M48_01120 [Candidatus Omnitrophica bacterium 4484_213]|nr:MAG: hypothetical protein B5M48_01120 [Candidatus Omnitrophica bacterium 4484_213]